MKKIKFCFSVCSLIAFVSCQSSSDNSTESNETPATPDTATQVEVEINELDYLPNDAFKLYTQDYIVEEYAGHLETNTYAEKYYAVVVTDNMELMLEIGHEGTIVDETYDMQVFIENAYGVEVTMELVDANHDGNENELVIWLSQSNGNNGIESGYEFYQKSVYIFDLTNRNVMLNLIYENEYASYYAGPNANQEDPDYHAKMAEDSEWDICSYSSELTFKDGDIIIGEFNFQKEGMGECNPISFTKGTYKFNSSTGKYEFIKE